MLQLSTPRFANASTERRPLPRGGGRASTCAPRIRETVDAVLATPLYVAMGSSQGGGDRQHGVT